MVNLGVLPGSNNFSRGYAINSRGDIVGFGTFGGSTRAYMQTAVIPVPGSLALMLSGVLAIAAVRLRRRQAR